MRKLDKAPEPVNPVFLTPATIIIAGLILVILLSALVFAVTGHAAVDSGGMRNFLAQGV